MVTDDQTFYLDIAESGRLAGRTLLAYLRSGDRDSALVTVAYRTGSRDQRPRFGYKSWFWEEPRGRLAIERLLVDLPPTLGWLECRAFDEWAQQHVYRLVNVRPLSPEKMPTSQSVRR